jgi:elongation factor G
VFKTVIEPHLGELSLIRVYSGTFESASEVFNSRRNSTEKLGQLYALQGNARTEVPRATAGDIVAAVKLKDTHTGDTLTSKAKPAVLAPPTFPSTLAAESIAPKKKGDEDKMGMAMHKIMEEDPTVHLQVDGELHQHVIRAMGELHIDVVMEKLRERHVEVELKKPRIHFRETITRKAEGQGIQEADRRARSNAGTYGKLEPSGRGGIPIHDDVVEMVRGSSSPRWRRAWSSHEGRSGRRLSRHRHHRPHLRRVAPLGGLERDGVQDRRFHGLQNSCREAGPVLLEPIAEVEVTVPENTPGTSWGIRLPPGQDPGHRARPGPGGASPRPRAEIYRYSAQLGP